MKMSHNKARRRAGCGVPRMIRLGAGLVLGAGLLLPTGLFAQGNTANLGGTVTDATGAVIPNAVVTLVNEASGDRRVSKSNGSGVFSFSSVPVGDYDVTITAQGLPGSRRRRFTWIQATSAAFATSSCSRAT